MLANIWRAEAGIDLPSFCYRSPFMLALSIHLSESGWARRDTLGGFPLSAPFPCNVQKRFRSYSRQGVGIAHYRQLCAMSLFKAQLV